MSVQPTPSGQIPRQNLERAGKSEGNGTSRRPAETPLPATPETRRDDVQISSQARELQELGANRPSSGELSAERLRGVLTRLSQGHYEQPDVQTEVVRRLAKDL